MTVSIIAPFDAANDEHRKRAHDFVLERLHQIHPTWEIIEAGSPDPWSKGAAVATAAERAAGDVLVLHDADSYVDPDNLDDAVRLIESSSARWVVPHSTVHRLRQAETERVYAGARARRGHVVRQPYTGPAGGGITVLDRDAYDAVNGIDPRFLGWGGEDLAFGWALETLVGRPARLSSPLIHLWHVHPAPDLRGSPDSEALVAEYRRARGMHRRMRQLIDRQPVTEPEPLATPARFRIPRGRNHIRIGDTIARFQGGQLDTTDPDLADALRAHSLPTEVTR